jgi:hypothetical protein
MSDDTDRINALERLPRRRSPERDLWPGIEARLAPRRRSHYPLAQFALAASLVAGLAMVMTLGLRDASLTPAFSTETLATAERGAPMRAQTFDSEAIVQANLSLIEQAERELRQALLQDPESTTLRSLLQSAERRQLTLRAML